MTHSDALPAMPDTRGEKCQLFPILFQYYNPKLTAILWQWNNTIIFIEDHNLPTSIAFLLANDLSRSSADNKWYFVVYKDRQPGIYTEQ